MAREQLADRFRRAQAQVRGYLSTARTNSHEDLYMYLDAQCDRGITLSSVDYDPNNHDMPWDDTNIVIDRDKGSLGGSIVEIAVYLDDEFDSSNDVIQPCFSKQDQVYDGLDFRHGRDAHQVKSGIVSLTGGAIVLTEDLFSGKATVFHIVTRHQGTSWRYRGTKAAWQLAWMQEKQRYDGEKLPKTFTFNVRDLYLAGITKHYIFDWATQ